MPITISVPVHTPALTSEDRSTGACVTHLGLFGFRCSAVSLTKSFLVCLILCVVDCVSKGGPVWLSVWLWQAVYREACCCRFQSAWRSECFVSLIPPPLSPLCFVCPYQYGFVSISGLTSICLFLSCSVLLPRHSWQRENQGKGPILLVQRHQESPLSLCSDPLLLLTMTLLASERSLLIRNKFRSGEELHQALATMPSYQWRYCWH